MFEQLILGKAIPVPKGNYSAGTRYDRLNMVTSHGGAYIATKDNVQGVQPGVTSGWENYWQCVGNGIIGITKTAETASQATFTVSYSDGTTSTYTIDKLTSISDGTVDFTDPASGQIPTREVPQTGMTLSNIVKILAGNSMKYDLTFTHNGDIVTDTYYANGAWLAIGTGNILAEFQVAEDIGAGAWRIAQVTNFSDFSDHDIPLTCTVLSTAAPSVSASGFLQHSYGAMYVITTGPMSAGDRILLSGTWYHA